MSAAFLPERVDGLFMRFFSQNVKQKIHKTIKFSKKF